tara:strand:+ start:1693 stop:2166 length:474 start_codon:yes stop_codon:yes gene_type:complete
MNKKHDDKLALENLSIIDMERVILSIDCISGTESPHIKAALFRDAVISYAKPFLKNKFSDNSKGLCISTNHVPKNLKSVHKEVLDLRNELIAHTDMAIQNPEISRYKDEIGEMKYWVSVTGYRTIHKEYLLKPLQALAEAVQIELINSRGTMVKNNF